MLWKFRYLWPSRAHFVLNFYRHGSFFVLQNRNGMASFLHSRLGVTQKDPLAMVVYDIENTPLESFQLHMGFSFPFLRANDLR